MIKRGQIMRVLVSVLFLCCFTLFASAQEGFLRDYISLGKPFKVVFGPYGFTDFKWIGRCDPDIANTLCGKTYTGRYLDEIQGWEFSTFNELTRRTEILTSKDLSRGNPANFKMIIWDEEFSFDEKGRVSHPGDGKVANLYPIEYSPSKYYIAESTREPINLRNEGYDLIQRHEYEKAIGSLDKSIELSPKSPLSYYYRGYAYMKERDYDRAILDFKKSISLDPNLSGAYAGLAVLQVELEDYEEAMRAASKAIELNPEDASSYYNRGLAYYYLKEYEKAYRDFDEALRLDPTNQDARTNRDLLLEKMGKQ
jgi:tetratricopeptide (TPR) repeat protein